MEDHVKTAAKETGFPLIELRAKLDLYGLIDEWNALPNWRQRWCTRILKIEPCLAFLKKNPDATLLVGLRADEEERKGLYSDSVKVRFPLREWGWDVDRVLSYLRRRGVSIPKRTDCALCYAQRTSEWFDLWRNHPERYARGVELEDQTGYTFRNPSKTSWPATLRDLAAAFERGRRPRGREDFDQLDLFDDEDDTACRVCRL